PPPSQLPSHLPYPASAPAVLYTLSLHDALPICHHLDWSDLKADRARAAYDIFHPLDGKFDDNVIVQIKYGPIDFQVREPASPLLDRKSTRLNSSHVASSYAVFCFKKTKVHS